MNKKIAIPVDESGRLNSHFGHSTFFELFDVEDGVIVANEQRTPPPHTPGAIPKWLAANNVTDVIAGGIGEKASKILEHFNVNIHKGAATLSAKSLVDALLNGTLVLSNENCRHDHLHDHHHNHHHGENLK